ncbi:GntR family transcriptional regulator [Vagococcus sp. BWB3-3]|uniref:GntR family transcriptional regulator n=1 Tax=Vagococcus allomyrinae TaxID=2794353 RepID=A0A940PDS6_9ENTE|nr:GntR family transcriptional regulator [Vagococcus allomyrinae]MBP1040958.1 GntR family transcriptional regulator [Vagococcus allomyrinae]
MSSIDRTSGIPIYEQLTLELSKYIERNQAGDFIPTEKELEKEYEVSRITVRKAVDQLVDKGYLEKIQGKGTRIVNTGAVGQNIGSVFSWTEEMASKNIETHTIEQSLKRITPSKKLKRELSLADNETVICLERVRTVEREPVAITINYIREKFVPGFFAEGLQKESLYQQLEELYGIQFLMADETISARDSTSLEAFKLNIKEDAAVLNVRRISYLSKNVPFEVVDMVARGDRYHYLAKLEGRKNHSIQINKPS